MKKKLGFIGCILMLAAALLLLTGCEDGPSSNYEYFQQIMNNVSLPYGCTEWKILPADYDGDGRVEAFAFTGRPETGVYTGTSQTYVQWNYLTVYYISAAGIPRKMLVNSSLVGDPYGTSSLYQTSFPKCYYSVGTKKIALLAVGEAGGGCGYSMVLGVSNGSPVVDYVDGSLSYVSGDKLYVAGLGEDLVYQMQSNGTLRYLYSINTDY